MKVCKGCHVKKDPSEFGVNKMGQGGLRSRCKACIAKVASDYVRGESYKKIDKNRESDPVRKAKRRSYVAKHRTTDKGEINRRNAYLRKFGLNSQSYDRILDQQDGKCAICKGLPEGKRLSVDHCHDTGRIRGLLCIKCNSGIGLLCDSILLVESALAYLKK